MTLLQLSIATATLCIAAYLIWKTKAAMRKEEDEANPAIIKDRQECLSVWALAHEWTGTSPRRENSVEISDGIRRYLDRITLAYFRKEISLRKKSGYRLIGHSYLEAILGLDKEHNKLWESFTKEPNIKLLDSLYVMRSDLLNWCPQAHIDPPQCWASTPKAQLATDISEEESETGEWYRNMSDQRKRKTACLEIAKHLWKRDPSLLYEEIRTHHVMRDAGLDGVFSSDTFKTWARPYASEEAKAGGRRFKSAN